KIRFSPLWSTVSGYPPRSTWEKKTFPLTQRHSRWSVSWCDAVKRSHELAGPGGEGWPRFAPPAGLGRREKRPHPIFYRRLVAEVVRLICVTVSNVKPA